MKKKIWAHTKMSHTFIFCHLFHAKRQRSKVAKDSNAFFFAPFALLPLRTLRDTFGAAHKAW